MDYELHPPDTIFFQHFQPNRKIEIENFKDFKNLKPHRNLDIFHEALI